jgi:hypothetical protein
MAKKSKSKKSKAKKTKPEVPEIKSETPDEAVAPSWSTDDVYTLLKAVNEVTLRRMENKIDALTQRVTVLQDQAKAIKDRPEFNLPATRQTVDSVFSFLNNSLYPNIMAIKAKTDRLP